MFWVVFIYCFTSCNAPATEPGSQDPAHHQSGLPFDPPHTRLVLTRHARCRMDCRHITQAEVEDIMRNGDINYRKSEVDDKPCPVYALEGFVNNEKLRIVFAQCDQKTKVVTVIDLDKEWQCDCPGDDKKYKNRN